jgi:phosphatidylserine/phosphatidylglycerophosphate/cardiolipin synthase-like enzyme
MKPNFLLASLLLWLTACTSVPFDYPKTETGALPADVDSPLGATGLAWQQEHGDRSGILLLPEGMDALGARLSLMEVAERSIDAQYFIVKKDRAGALFVGKLLRTAAELYEIRADGAGRENARGNPGVVTLHTKMTIIDGETIFVGSLNFDPRSLLINSEMGLFIESETLAENLTRVVRGELQDATYQVELDGEGELCWVDRSDGKPLIFGSPPQAAWGRRIMAGFYGLLPIENQL